MTIQQAETINTLLKTLQAEAVSRMEETIGKDSSLAERALYEERVSERLWFGNGWTTFPSSGEVHSVPISPGGVRAEWLIAADAATDRAIMYLHGGGYVAGNLDTHRELVARISKATKTRCVAVDYRRAPESVFPAQLEDSLTVYKWLLSEGFKPKKIAIIGDSCGGGLAIGTLVKLRELKLPLPAAAVLLSPWLDLESKGKSMWTNADTDFITRDLLLGLSDLFVGKNGDVKDPLASPINADLRGLPPILVLVGDIEVLLDDSTVFADRAKKASVDVTLQVWPGMPHIFPIFAPNLTEGQEAIEKIGEFVRRWI